MTAEELGNVALSKEQARLLQVLKPKDVIYNPKRVRPKYMPQSQLADKVWGPNYPADTLIVLCCTATWIAASRRALTILEVVNGEVLEQLRLQSMTGTAAPESGARGGEAGPSPLKLIASKLQLWELDLSEGQTIQSKFGFR